MLFTFFAKFSLLMILAAFISCNGVKENDGTGVGKGSYFPLSKGNTWSYKLIGSPGEAKYSVSVESVNERDTYTTARLNSFPFFWMKDDRRSLKLSRDGELSLVIDGGDDILLIPSKDKIKKDHNWKSGEWQCYITQTDTTVSEGGKDYKGCLQVNYSLSITYLAEIWYAPGTGIVRWGFNRTNPPNMNFEYYYLEKYEVE